MRTASNNARWAFMAALAMSLAACGGSTANLRAGTMPEGGSFTGVWHSPQYGEMHMEQTGDAVNGEYRKDERTGQIQGRVTGDVLLFEWTEERELVRGRAGMVRGRGYFRYSVDDNGDHRILGEWGYDDARQGAGPWEAVRDRRNLEPQISAGRGGADGPDDEGVEDFDTRDDTVDYE